MHRITRTAVAALCVGFIAVAASAAPEGRSESRDWITRTIDRVIVKVVKLFGPSPTNDPDIVPPKP